MHRQIPFRPATLWLAIVSSFAHAQLNLDGSMGPAGALAGPNFQIDAVLGRQTGSNLFHSFSLFNVNTGESATFNGPSSIENVLGRVTGGSASLINGLLRSTIPEANIFLLNPAGLLFGPSATLDVQGSFHASTADFIRLADGTAFTSLPSPSDVALTSAPPEAFGFLDDAVGPIDAIGSTLSVPSGETLSLVGGDTTVLSGALTAPSGQINLVSVGSAGEVVHGATPDVKSFAQLGKIELNAFPGASGSVIDASGEGGRGIFIRGGVLTLDGGSDIRTVAGVSSGGAGGSISLQADSIIQNSGSDVSSLALSTDRGGNIDVKAEQLTLTSNSAILAGTTG